MKVALEEDDDDDDVLQGVIMGLRAFNLAAVPGLQSIPISACR